MKTRQEHIDELCATIVNCRLFCGNEREAVREYFADNGFSRTNIDLPIIRQKAYESAEVVWSQYQAEAGVTNPISTEERAQITRDLESK